MIIFVPLLCKPSHLNITLEYPYFHTESQTQVLYDVFLGFYKFLKQHLPSLKADF